MEQSPEISVVIPVYNCEKYVGEAIESVLNQPYQNILLVLVDDGSTDASPEICDSYAHAHDRVTVIHQKNGGVSSARNTGIEYVLEKKPDTAYIAFLDADDRWSENFMTPNIVQMLNQKHDLVGFQTARCNNAVTRHTPLVPMEEGLHPGGNLSVWKNSKQTFGSAFYALLVIRQYGLRFPDKLKNNEDLIFSMQFKYLAKDLFLVNKLLYLYRNNQFSASHRRVDAISKYTPMIDAYLQSDQLMEQYQNEQRGVLWEGRAMAAVYIVDILEEHYQNFGSSCALTQMFENHPEYLELITGSFACNRSDSGLRWKSTKAHPVRFRLKCYVMGATKTILRMVYLHLYQIRAISKLIDKMRYPVEL